jgi:outer membrane protein TolC
LTATLLFATPSGAVERFSLEEAIAFALEHHPSLWERAALEKEAGADVAVERAEYAPALDLSLQLNRATGNVVPGSYFSMHNFPSVTGPPAPTVFNSGRFGTAAGVVASWDVVGLVRRMALVDAALQQEHATEAGTSVRRLEVAFLAANAFLTVVVRGEARGAALASVERAQVFATTVKALVDQELRPGADLSRAEAELALASTQLIREEEAEAVAKVQLAEALGIPGRSVEAIPGSLLARTQATALKASAAHPAVVEAQANVRTAGARKHAVDLRYLPRLDVVAGLWVRGSGIDRTGGAAGLLPDVPNWGAGLVLSWPVLEVFGDQARSRAEAARVEAASARGEGVSQAIQAQVEMTRAILEGAHRVAKNTPLALAAAKAAEQQARARYQSGLAPVLEVAEAQRLLAQAELEDAEARLGVRSAMLLVARSLGDLEPFLDDLRESGRGGR